MKYILKGKTVTRYFTGLIKDSGLFEAIDRIAGELEAIEATSWAEIACLDETYEHEFFTLTIAD